MRTLVCFRRLFTAVIILTIPLGCAKRPEESFVPGKTTVSQITQQMGSPLHTSNPSIRREATILHYADRTQFQIERGLMVGSSFPPSPQEVTLQYWRHKWRGRPQSYVEIINRRDPHGGRVFQLISPQDGKAVIYEEETDRVREVVNYVPR